MNKILKITAVSAIVLLVMALFYKGTQNTRLTSNNYEIKAIKTPTNLTFCNEDVPLYNKEIVERIDKELLVNTYWQSNTMLVIKRANKFFPIMEPILEKYGIPEDFKYLAVIESGLQNVSSPAGAKGFWQIMPETAKEYGLTVNDNVDERYHLEKSTVAACKYLLTAKKKLGSWTAAAASYNIGLNGIHKRLNEQLVDNYYDLFLPEETSRYVPRILAVKEILERPYDFGYSYEKEDLYNFPKFKVVTVDSSIVSLAHFAKKFNTNYKNLKLLNPWLRDSKLTNTSNALYEIKIPTE